MTNVNEIRYVFDLKREYVVPKHIINYLKMYGVFVDCGRHLYSPKKEGFDYYRAAFSYYGKDIKQVRDDQSCAWILDLPNHDQIMIFDNGDISFNMVLRVRSINTPFCCKISCNKSDDRICLTIDFGKNRKTKVDISKNRLGCIDIVLYDIWAILYQSKQPRRCQILPGHPYTTDEYIEMLKEDMQARRIHGVNELRWIYAMFDDPRLYQFLDTELGKLPTSLEEWYNPRLRKIFEDGNNIDDRESLMIDRSYLEDEIVHSEHLVKEQLPRLVKFDGRNWKQ